LSFGLLRGQNLLLTLQALLVLLVGLVCLSSGIRPHRVIKCSLGATGVAYMLLAGLSLRDRREASQLEQNSTLESIAGHLSYEGPPTLPEKTERERLEKEIDKFALQYKFTLGFGESPAQRKNWEQLKKAYPVESMDRRLSHETRPGKRDLSLGVQARQADCARRAELE